MKKTEPNSSHSQKLEVTGLDFLIGFVGLLIFQLLGEIIVRLLGLPVPGPVIGLLCMLIFLLLRKKFKAQESTPLLNTSSVLLTHLSLLFVPAGVGIITHIDRLKEQWFAIAVALLIASVITLLVTAWSLKIFIRLMHRPEPK